MEIIIAILAVLVVILGFTTFNLLRKQEKAEAIMVGYLNYLDQLSRIIDISDIKFYNGLSSQIAFDVKYDSDNDTTFSKYHQQFDDIYWSGAKAVEDSWYNEDYEYFAPLFIKKQNLLVMQFYLQNMIIV